MNNTLHSSQSEGLALQSLKEEALQEDSNISLLKYPTTQNQEIDCFQYNTLSAISSNSREPNHEVNGNFMNIVNYVSLQYCQVYRLTSQLMSALLLTSHRNRENGSWKSSSTCLLTPLPSLIQVDLRLQFSDTF
jgi:hypothetical protein